MIGLRQSSGVFAGLAVTSILVGMVLFMAHATMHTHGRRAEGGLCTFPHMGLAPCGGR